MALSDFKNSIITQDKFSQTFNKFDRSVQGSARGLDKLGGILSGGGLGMLFGGLAGTADVMAIGRTAFELGNLGAQSLTTKASFESLMRSVGLSTRLLDDLKAASGGTITELVLMQQANTALAGSSGQLATEMGAALPKLLEAARAAAKLNPAYGDAEFMFQSLVGGIKRGTPLLIDNTGIVLKVGEATEKYAASIGKSVTQLTSQERSLAILRGTLEGADRLIEQTAGSMNSMASSAGQLKTAWMELKTVIGESIAPTTSGIQQDAAAAFQGITAALRGDELTLARQELARMEEQYRLASNAGDSFLGTLQRLIYGEQSQRDALEQSRNEITAQRNEIIRLERELIGYENASEGARFASGRFGASATIAAANIGTLTFALRQAKEAAAGLGGAMGGLPAEYKAGLNSAFGQVYGMGSAIPQGEADKIYSGYARAYAQLELDRSAISRAEYTRRKADLDAALADQLASYRSFGTSVAAVATDAGDAIKSKISNALTPTFDLSGLTGGALGGQMGDTFDEAYKRLAAVALRPEELQIHAGDWASTFEQAGLTGLTPEEAQQRARELVEAYSRGLDFSLIDREKIKNQVRQAIKAEELYNSIVDEIYAEMGKEKPKLGQVGTGIGTQINRAVTATVKSGASDYVAAWADVLTPELIRRLDARGRRTGQVQ